MSNNNNASGHGCQFQPDPGMEKLKDRVSRIAHKLLVLSGKGGVGKSTVAVNTALALAKAGKKVGILDVDIHGPSIPGILGLIGQTIESSDDGLVPVQYNENVKVMSVGFLLKHTDDAVIWRGPMKNSVIKQFLSDVAWGDLDYLIVDAPPGTGDEPLSVAQLMPEETSAIIVTTPQLVAITDVRKSIDFCRKLGVRILGVVENMSGFVCPHCNEKVDIFSTGGGEKMAQEMEIPFLGAIPLDPAIVTSSDRADDFLEKYPDSPAALAYGNIMEPVLAIDADRAHDQTFEQIKAPEKEDFIRIALPVANGKLCLHFGHCQVFEFIDASKKSGEILNQFSEEPPPHEPGVLPSWVHEKGAHMVIAGGMGSRAKGLFEQNDVKVLTGAPSDDPRKIVAAFMKGSLETGSNVCDH